MTDTDTTIAPAITWSPRAEAIFGWFAVDPDRVAVALLAAGLAADQPEAIALAKHLIVRARAGTGKTSVIIEGIRYAPETRILLAAFSKNDQLELAKRVAAVNPNAEAKTLHAVGFACVRRYWTNVTIAERSERATSLAEAVCGPTAPDPIKRLVAKLHTHGREIAPHAAVADDLLDVALEYDCEPDDDWEEIGYGLKYVTEKAVEAMVLAASEKPVKGIDFADMLFLPVRNKWLHGLYDLVVVDEAQDMTITQLEIAQGVLRPGGRMAVVGDDRQAIYGFRGADATSLDRLKAELHAVELGLTVTYRCGKNIVAEAKRLVPDYEAGVNAHDGEVLTLPSIEKMCEAAAPNDWILSRANAPLAKVAMALLKRQKRVRIQGKDIGAGLRALVKRLSTGRAAHSIPAFLERLATWRDREILRVTKLDREELIEGIRDKADVIAIIADGVTGPRELDVRIDNLFSDDKNHGSIVCSSVHKAKGREADRVFVLRDTLQPKLPVGVELTAKRAQEEANIKYVSITRAKNVLVWVSGK